MLTEESAKNAFSYSSNVLALEKDHSSGVECTACTLSCG
jgi:hypothetical protein